MLLLTTTQYYYTYNLLIYLGTVYYCTLILMYRVLAVVYLAASPPVRTLPGKSAAKVSAPLTCRLFRFHSSSASNAPRPSRTVTLQSSSSSAVDVASMSTVQRTWTHDGETIVGSTCPPVEVLIPAVDLRKHGLFSASSLSVLYASILCTRSESM